MFLKGDKIANINYKEEIYILQEESERAERNECILN